MTKDVTFFAENHYKWFWICVALLVVMSAVYYLDHPLGGANGGTVLGYTYGVIAALGMFFLMWFGMRKRSYHSSKMSLKSWLSAHVWIGLSLLIVVPLHCGFSFGWNVHTLTYILMVITIASGLWGAVMYVRYPALMRARREGLTMRNCLNDISLISTDLSALGKGRSNALLKLLNALDFSFSPNVWAALFGRHVAEVNTRGDISGMLASLPKEEYEEGLKMISLAHKKTALCNELIDETKIAALLRVWLFFHVPIAFGSMAALVIHIFSVFYYW